MSPESESRTNRGQAKPKHRSSRACQSCREAKSKCEVASNDSRCRRCVASATPCYFPESRRGRIKGSKNRRTLERLQTEQRPAASSTDHGDDDLEEDCSISEDEESPQRSQFQEPNTFGGSRRNSHIARPATGRESGDDASFQRPPKRQRINYKAAPRSGTTTPWNPHNLIMNLESGNGIHRPTLARKLLQVLGEFPVQEDDRSEDGGQTCKGFQDPLWLIAGLAEKGWEVDGARGHKVKLKHSSTLKEIGIVPEEAELLQKWTPEALQEIEREQNRYFEHGLLGSKFDVANDLDPIHHGLIAQEKADEVFQAYWDMIHPQWAMLDPDLHTLEYVRNRSALLTTTLLAIGATCLAVTSRRTEEQVAEALRLHSHADKLNLIVYATGARSVEIIQAQIVLCRWGPSPKVRLDELRWMRAGMIPRMASEIGLNFARNYGHPNGLDPEKAARLRQNDLRTRAFMIINEYRFFTYSGRQPIDLETFELKDEELDEISRNSGDRTSSAGALYDLYLLDRDVRRRLKEERPGRQGSVALDAELEHIKCHMERWITDWCPRGGDPNLNWHLIHDGLSCWLLLAVMIARKRAQSADATQGQRFQEKQQQQQQLLLNLSIRLFKECLKAPQAVRTTHRGAIFPFAASIILRLSSRHDLVLRVALRMAGEPGQPHVPTFVREAGNQMLVLLRKVDSDCFRLPSPAPDSRPVSGREASGSDETRTEEEPCSRMQDQQHIHGPTPAPTADNLPHMQSYPVAGQSFGYQGDTENVFPFNIADFPYVPDPAQSQPPPSQNCLLTSYGTDFDAWLGPPVPREFTDLERAAENQYLGAIGSEPPARTPFYETAMGMPLDMAPPMNHGHEAQDVGSNWGLEQVSPMTTAYTTNSTENRVNDRSVPRQVLLAAVDRLVQLASLIE